MATLDDLLNNFNMNDEEGMEHTASEQSSENEEQALLELLGNEEATEKIASEGGSEMSGSLADLYMQLAEQDNFETEKVAADQAVEEEVSEEASIEKVAQEYDAAGRIMARGFFDEFQKLARELEDGSDAQTPALGDRGTQWQMETNYEDKGMMHTQGGEQQHKNILKGQAEGPAGKAEGAMGPQFATAKHMVTGRAKQTNAS